MKVLIVDDNKNNRMILNLLLEDYIDEHKGVSFDITEVEDGLQAVQATKDNKYDLIFMDIMMPNMDGIEATAAIRRLDKKVMIIAVSAVDDNDRKKIILNNGAEDYISKPINADIFEVRLDSYIKLLDSRSKSTKSSTVVLAKPHNLFNKDIFPYETHFNGENKERLSAFWEYYLLNDTPYDGISDMVRFIFDMGLSALKDGRVDIFEENSMDYMYMTIRASKDFNPDTIMLYADKNNFVENYKLDGRILCTKLKKDKIVTLIEPKADVQIAEPEVNEVVSSPLEVQIPVSSKELHVFDILDPDDFEDLKDFISKLNSLLLILGSSPIEQHEADELVITMLQISKSISSYNELYSVGSALGALGHAIDENKEAFVEKSLELGPLAVAFGGDLSHWFKSLFIQGATSIDFLDDSIVSNAQIIQSFINPQSEAAADNDMDDIFDF
jgi:CheY-like chemotaxis protein